MLCSSLMGKVGTYADPQYHDCRIRVHCVNAPSLNAVYTGPGDNSTGCPWTCAVGYINVGGVCSVCPTPNGFNQSRHTYLLGTCQMTCKPTFYRTPTDATTCASCVDMAPDGSKYGIFARVHQYNTGSYVKRTAWQSGMSVCGTTETIPGTHILTCCLWVACF